MCATQPPSCILGEAQKEDFILLHNPQIWWNAQGEQHLFVGFYGLTAGGLLGTMSLQDSCWITPAAGATPTPKYKRNKGLEMTFMKNWKKIVAMLLACVMTLAMLTACGGASAENTQVETQVMNEINSQRRANRVATLENDDDLNEDAMRVLREIGADGKIDISKAIQLNGKKLVSVANVKWNLSAVSGKVEVESFQGIEGIDFGKYLPVCEKDVNVEIKLPNIKVGVAALTVNGKTYVAIAIEYVNPVQPL